MKLSVFQPLVRAVPRVESWLQPLRQTFGVVSPSEEIATCMYLACSLFGCRFFVRARLVAQAVTRKFFFITVM